MLAGSRPHALASLLQPGPHMTRRLHALLALFLAVGLSARADAARPGARQVKNSKLSAYAKHRERNHDVKGRRNGTFAGVARKDKLVRTRLIAHGHANGASAVSATTVAFRPARGSSTGSLDVDIPEMHIGATPGNRTIERTLRTTDISGNEVLIHGKLTMGANPRMPHPSSGYVKATFTGTVPAGARLSQRQIAHALKGLQVNELSLTWSKPSAR